MRIFNDAREQLPHDVAPGEAVEIGFGVRAPAAPGRYVLEFDMVQEHVCWFATHGSPTGRMRVKVAPAAARAAAHDDSARMQMFGIPRAEVEALVAASGGRLLGVDESDAAGAAWISYRYVATR
jgi:hypothetical protein